MTTLIIGKQSNLSQELSKKIPNSTLFSSRELSTNIELLLEFKSQKINIIFNNFQTALQLNETDHLDQYIENAIGITSKVLEYFRQTDINKIIYTSSSSVYGNNILCHENDEVKPLNLHASLKVANEKLIQKYCADRKINSTIARIFNMYGGDDNFSIISKIINAHKNNSILSIVNNGNAIRDFIHIDDVINVYVKLLDKKNIPILNIGTGDGNSIKNLLIFLKNYHIQLNVKNIQKEELKISTADNRLLMQTFHIKSFINIETYLLAQIQKEAK